MKIRRYTPLLLLILIISGSCRKHGSDISFYHWKSSYDPSPTVSGYLEQLKPKKQYIRFFDVVWDAGNNAAIPQSIINFKEVPDSTMEVVPVVYITNRAMLNLPDHKVEELSGNIIRKIEELYKGDRFGEIQLDCDWTLKTRDRYFSLIKHIRSNGAISKISATIRLHQIKFYKKTGVPPVDRGVLMFYNMGDISDPEEINSILNLEKARPYLVNLKDYPLEWDLALPLFEWAVQYRHSRVVQLLNTDDLSVLLKSDKFKELEPNMFRVQESTYLGGVYVYKGDEIRLETTDIDDLREAVDMVNDFKASGYDIIYYHLDESVLKRFSASELKNLN